MAIAVEVSRKIAHPGAVADRCETFASVLTFGSRGIDVGTEEIGRIGIASILCAQLLQVGVGSYQVRAGGGSGPAQGALGTG